MNSLVRLTFRVKLHGRGPRAEADAARRSPHVSRRDCGRRAARQPCELTSRLGRRASAGPCQLLRGVSRPIVHFRARVMLPINDEG
jgi:hypothetical protein